MQEAHYLITTLAKLYTPDLGIIVCWATTTQVYNFFVYTNQFVPFSIRNQIGMTMQIRLSLKSNLCINNVY